MSSANHVPLSICAACLVSAAHFEHCARACLVKSDCPPSPFASCASRFNVPFAHATAEACVARARRVKHLIAQSSRNRRSTTGRRSPRMAKAEYS
eukprot:2385233-Pleurochrysis_carterae.AAC.1